MLPQKIENLIIGAGIAGLGAAYTLRKKGKEVIVLEKESFVGGRMSTITVEGVPIDLGAKFLLPSAYKNISKLSLEFNISFRPIPASKFAVMKNGIPVSCDGKNIFSVLQYQGLSTKAKLQLGLLIAYQLLRYRNLDMYHLERSLFLDNESVYDYFRKWLSQECFEYLLDPMCSALFSYNSKEFSRAFFLSVLPKMMKADFYSFEGGINKLCLELAKQVPVQCNISIKSVKRIQDTIIVMGEDVKKKKQITFHAKKVIIAIPGNKVLSIVHNPTKTGKTFFSQVQYSKATIIHFRGKSELFNNYRTLWFPEKESKYFISIVKNFYSPDSTEMSVFELGLRQSFVNELQENKQYTKQTIAKIISKELGIKNVEIFHITEWEGMCPKVEPGYLKRRYEFLEQTKDKKQIFYCGDYLENPSTEGALTSGLSTAEKLL